MSLQSYQKSVELSRGDPGFYALVLGARARGSSADRRDLDYHFSDRLNQRDPYRDMLAEKMLKDKEATFEAFLFAAIRKADPINRRHLEDVYPNEVKEFELRYWAPGGWLDGDETHD